MFFFKVRELPPKYSVPLPRRHCSSDKMYIYASDVLPLPRVRRPVSVLKI